jgi:hypothetical protein
MGNRLRGVVVVANKMVLFIQMFILLDNCPVIHSFVL